MSPQNRQEMKQSIVEKPPQKSVYPPRRDYCTSPLWHPRKIARDPVPRTIPLAQYLNTWLGRAPCPERVTLDSNTVKRSRCIFVFFIRHCARVDYMQDGSRGPRHSLIRFTAGNELHGALVLLQRPVKKSILFLRTAVVTVDIPCPGVTGARNSHFF